MLSGAGELDPEAGGTVPGREMEGLKRPWDETGVLLFVLRGREVDGGRGWAAAATAAL